MPSKRQALICRAKSSRTGQPCRKYAIIGGVVCRTHGGSLPWVKEAAQRRLQDLVMPAITTLHRLVQSAETDAVALGAAKDILDRCGFKVSEKVQAETEVRITVSYQDVGMAPPSGPRRTGARNGYHALDGDRDV